jgi:hypothetical protein
VRHGPCQLEKAVRKKWFVYEVDILGVANGPEESFSVHCKNAKEKYVPLRATVFFLTELIAMSGITVFPPFNTGVTLTSSH